MFVIFWHLVKNAPQIFRDGLAIEIFGEMYKRLILAAY